MLLDAGVAMMRRGTRHSATLINIALMPPLARVLIARAGLRDAPRAVEYEAEYVATLFDGFLPCHFDSLIVTLMIFYQF